MSPVLSQDEASLSGCVVAARMTATALNVVQPLPSVVLITSMRPGEGKTTAAVRLANTLDDAVLIDADLRRPAAHKSLGERVGFGLSDVLRSRVTLEEAIRPTAGPALLTAGGLVDRADELLAERFADVLSGCRDWFSTIVIDSPPVGVVDDAIAIAPLADAVLGVVREGWTHRSDLRRLREAATVSGVIWNVG